MGRITATEAERLIAAWSADREVQWIAAAGIALVVAQGILQGQVFGHPAHALALDWHWVAQRAIAWMRKGLGGL